jgi:putative nucleotidyltransferase with HDIG domain
MKTMMINIDKCIPGMKVAKWIHNEYGAIIVARDTILDDHIINKLKNLYIDKIMIYDETDNVIITNSSDAFKVQYNKNVEIIKEILHDISSGKSVDINKIDEITDSIIIKINENSDIVRCINQMRTADEYTYTHSVNVAFLCMLIGKWMNMDIDNIRMLVKAGLLHDIGKSMIDTEILNKPGLLTDQEYEEIKKHALYGYRIIEKLQGVSKEVAMGVLMHHEREDGSGYPMGIRSEQIHGYAKVIAVADTYDAMTSNRVYKEKESPFDALDEIIIKTFGTLDTKCVRAFMNNIASYYIGDRVRLNTGETAVIIYINPANISRPIVKVDEKFIDLSYDYKIRIVELL